jgi:hypothetical protein
MCSALEIFAAVDASLHVIAPLRRSVRLVVILYFIIFRRFLGRTVFQRLRGAR